MCTLLLQGRHKSVIIFIAIGSFLSSVVIKPVKVMAERLTDISQGEGDLTQRLEERSKDESGQMAHAFNQFVHRPSGDNDLRVRLGGCTNCPV